MENRERHLAKEFILHTERNIFLTGKAGTGKTTLLHEILKETSKQTAVVAPTGVAAINAGGMTIHSMFQLPISAFLPTHRSNADPSFFTDQYTLSKSQRINKERRRLFAELELLIIDEISMVRGDLLDAVDFTLRRIRGNSRPFGGIQLLAIGDLFQLAPVVKNHEIEILRQFYRSRFFFDSLVWQSCDPIRIELEKVYRQEEAEFLQILNHIRHGKEFPEDIDKLNLRYREIAESEGVITLTTHNRKADKINQFKLDNLTGEVYKLDAMVRGKFAETSFPTPKQIVLKKGAQIMFIRNHAHGLYYNGKIGTVTGMFDDSLFVRCDDQESPIPVDPIEWKNTRFRVDKETKEIVQEDLGSFQQYPVKLAWAVTVHKSQGLTFDQVILDLESTFAPGQLYVALSRCRTLGGLTLSSRIQAKNVIVDHRILQYYKNTTLDAHIEDQLSKDKQRYEDHLLLKAFALPKIMLEVDSWIEFIADSELPEKSNAVLLSAQQKSTLQELNEVSNRFNRQLGQLIQAKPFNLALIRDRASKAIHYFSQNVYHKLIDPLEDHRSDYEIKTRTRKYIREIDGVLSAYWQYLENLYRLTLRSEALFESDKRYERKQPTKKTKQKKESTAEITFKLYRGGMDLREIAEARSLKIGTIRSHMVQWIASGKIQLMELMPQERVDKLYKEFLQNPDAPTSELKRKMGFEVDWYELQWIRAHHQHIMASIQEPG